MKLDQVSPKPLTPTLAEPTQGPSYLTITPIKLLPPGRPDRVPIPWRQGIDPDFHLGYVGAE